MLYVSIIEEKESALEIVSIRGANLQFCSENLRDDKDVVLAAVSNYGLSLRLASDRLRNDIDVALASVRNDSRSLQYVSFRLRLSEPIMEEIYSQRLSRADEGVKTRVR